MTRALRQHLSFRAFVIAVQSIYEIVVISLCIVLMFTLFRVVALLETISRSSR